MFFLTIYNVISGKIMFSSFSDNLNTQQIFKKIMHVYMPLEIIYW